MDFLNKWLTCVQCGRQFLWDAGEQSWYYMRHFEHPPRRCKHCRELNRTQRTDQPRPLVQARA